MGGIQVVGDARRAWQPGRTCPHSETMSTIAAGLERSVCETCGHLSFRWHEDVSDYIDRERTTNRSGVTAHDVVDLGLFALDARFGIRSRYELHPEPSALAS